MFKILSSLLLTMCLLVGCIPQSEITTDAYTAQIQADKWTVQLKPQYFFPEVKSVSVTFGGVLYGIYLTKDKVVLPNSPTPKQLILTGYDENNKLIMKTIFTLPR